MDEPFRGRRAVREGRLTHHALRTRYRALYRDVYVAKDVTVTAAVRARAAWLWADGHGVLSGESAAAVHGAKWLNGDLPADIVRADRHSPAGIVVRSYNLVADEVCTVRGMRATSPARTAFDIGRTHSEALAVPVIDAVMAATRVTAGRVLAIADTHRGLRGVRTLRTTIDKCDGGAESPQESRLRLAVVNAGLPRPETQVEFQDEYGHPFIRVDMAWPEWKVVLEYDGIQHWSDRRQRSWDIERIALLEAMGWKVIRVSAEMLPRPVAIIDRVRTTLRARGCPI